MIILISLFCQDTVYSRTNEQEVRLQEDWNILTDGLGEQQRRVFIIVPTSEPNQ